RTPAAPTYPPPPHPALPAHPRVPSADPPAGHRAPPARARGPATPATAQMAYACLSAHNFTTSPPTRLSQPASAAPLTAAGRQATANSTATASSSQPTYQEGVLSSCLQPSRPSLT